MVADGEDDLICDFAQTYHILDWRGLPLPLAATLASGLPGDSRCKLRITGAAVPLQTMLLASLTDQVSLMLWRYAKEGTPKPESILQTLFGKESAEPKIRSFRTGEEFERELQRHIS